MTKRILLITGLILIFCGLYLSPAGSSLAKESPVRIGFFDGGRVHLFYRTFINKYFDKEGVDVELYSKYLNKSKFFKAPKSHKEMERKISGKSGEEKHFGKARGTEIIQAMEMGKLEGGTVGESSFVYAVNTGSPLVAVAMLGHDTLEMPGKGIILRKDVVIKTREDFKGKILTTRRAGPGDAIFLREFLESIGLDPEEDLTIIDQVPGHKEIELINKNASHGMLAHLHRLEKLVKEGTCYLYRRMDWMNPEISHALLVFRKDFLESHPEEVKKIVRAYMKKIKQEYSLPEEERIKEKRRGLQMVLYFQGMNLPQYDYPPLVRLDLLEEIQRLLLKYQFIDEEVDLENFVNNDFVKEIYEELN